MVKFKYLDLNYRKVWERSTEANYKTQQTEKEDTTVIDIWRPHLHRPWRPFRELEEMERSLESPFAGRPLPLIWRRVPGDGMAWAPSVDKSTKWEVQ